MNGIAGAARKGNLDIALMRAKQRLGKSVGTDRADPIVIKDRSRVHVIPLKQVDYVEAQGDYVAFHAGGRSYLKLQPISNLETSLDASRFVRVHRSKIVNLERITRISPYAGESALTLVDGTRMGISRAGYARLLEAVHGAPAAASEAVHDTAATASAAGA